MTADRSGSGRRTDSLEEWLSNSLARWVDLIARWAWWVVLLFALATGVSLYHTVRYLSIDTDTVDMLSEKLPFQQAYKAYRRAFPQYVDTLLLVVEGQTPELARDAAQDLAERLKDNRTLFLSVYRPGAGEFFDTHALLYLSVPELEELADNLANVQPFLGRLSRDHSLRGLLSMAGSALEAVREGTVIDLAPLLRSMNEATAAALAGRYYQLSWQGLMRPGKVSWEDRHQFIVVQPHLDYSKMLPAEPAIRAIREAAAELSGKGWRLRLTGEVALSHEELQSVVAGTSIAGVVALGLVLLVLTLGLRSFRLVAATLITLLVGLVLTAGFATVAVGRLNLISVAFAVLFIGLVVDFTIYFCMHYLELIDHGAGERQALRDAARWIGPSVALCAITTAVGFYAFIPTAYAGVSELGLIAGTGIFIGLAVTLTLLPALLSLWRAKPYRPVADSGLVHLRERLASLPLRHARAVRIGALVLGLGALLLLPQVRFDYNPINLRDPYSESVRTYMDIAEHSARSPWSAVVLAQDAAAARDYAARLRRLDTVDEVVTIEDFIPERQADKLAIIDEIALIVGPQLTATAREVPPTLPEQVQALRDFLGVLRAGSAPDPVDRWPEARQLRTNLQALLERLDTLGPEARQSLVSRLEQSLLSTLPDSLRMLESALQAGAMGLNALPQELKERWVSPNGTYRIEVYPAVDMNDNSALRRFADEVRSVAPHVTDTPVVSLAAGDAVITAFQQAFLGALLVIALLLALILRNIIDVMLVLAPLLLASVLTGAATVLLDMPFNFANIIVLPLLLGVSVDGGIHMVYWRRSAAPQQRNPLRTSTARAIWYSALTTILSFGSLSVSAHPGTASLGRLLTIGVLLTLLSTLLVLPALLKLRRGWVTDHERENGL